MWYNQIPEKDLYQRSFYSIGCSFENDKFKLFIIYLRNIAFHKCDKIKILTMNRNLIFHSKYFIKKKKITKSDSKEVENY